MFDLLFFSGREVLEVALESILYPTSNPAGDHFSLRSQRERYLTAVNVRGLTCEQSTLDQLIDHARDPCGGVTGVLGQKAALVMAILDEEK